MRVRREAMSSRTFSSVLAVVLVILTRSRDLSAQQWVEVYHNRPWAAAAASAVLRDCNDNGIPDLICFSSTSGNAPDLLVVVPDPGIAPWPSVPPAPILNSYALPVPGIMSWFDVRDFDGDGRSDVVVGVGIYLGAVDRIYVLFGVGGGAFSAPVLVVSTFSAGSAVFGDFNADGRCDLAIIAIDPLTFGSNLEVHLANAATPFTLALVQALTVYATPSLVAGDFNGDGADDVAYGVTTISTQSDMLLQGLPVGSAGQPATFGSPIPLTTTILAAGLSTPRVYDYDGDGCDDMIGVGGYYRGLAAGGFAAAVPLAGFNGSADPCPADTNGDGIEDFLGMVPASVPMRFRLLECRGPFGVAVQSTEVATIPAAQPSLSVPQTPSGSFMSGDLDGDGDTDAVILERAAYLSGFHVVENRSHYGLGIAGFGGFPRISHTTPALGTPAFSIGLANARPASLAVLLLSLNPVVSLTGGIQVNLNPGAVLLVNGQWISGMTDPLGNGAFTSSLPSQPSLVGFTIFAQWGILDPSSSFQVGSIPIALTEGRAITFR